MFDCWRSPYFCRVRLSNGMQVMNATGYSRVAIYGIESAIVDGNDQETSET
jgi:hypothetical protein